jgi:hypothetical protein
MGLAKCIGIHILLQQYVSIGLRYIETVFLYSIGFYYFLSTNFS